MYLDTLHESVRMLCKVLHWSQEAAAERCSLSIRHFGDIVRGNTAPSVRTLEKLCTGFETSPNDLLVDPANLRDISYRLPMKVTHLFGK